MLFPYSQKVQSDAYASYLSEVPVVWTEASEKVKM